MKIKSITKVILDEPKQYYDVIEATPYHNFLIKTNNSYIVSHNCNFTDEVNFSAMTSNIEKIKQKQMKLISQVDVRMQSRFMKGTKSPAVNIIASSKDSEQSFLESFIDIKRKNESKTSLIIDEPQWVIRTDKDSPIKFWVAIGNKQQASEILPMNSTDKDVRLYRDKGFEMIQVPIGYWEQFNDNIDIALTDIAGISTVGARKFISGPRLKEIKTDKYKNPFSRDVIEVGTKDDLQYGDFMDLSLIDKEDMRKPMYVHLDLSKTGDKTGIAGIWITEKRVGDDNSAKELYFKVGFSVSIKAPKGDEISFEKSRMFIRWLRSKGFKVKGVSSDTYQSATVLQNLRADGFDASVLSVDVLEGSNTTDEQGKKHRICKPYIYFRSCIYDKRIELYDVCDLLTNEIVALERKPDGHIDHPQNGSKDQVDAVCGAIYNASLHVADYTFDYGENLKIMVDVNDTSNEVSDERQQFVVNMEQEMMRAWQNKAIQEQLQEEEKQRQEVQNSQNEIYKNTILFDSDIIMF